MPKRTFWTTVGYGLGIGSSVFVQRRVRRTVARMTPEGVRREVGQRTAAVAASSADAARGLLDRARTTSGDVVAAVREGREVARAEESALREEYGLPARRRPVANLRTGTNRSERG
jgi:hypothetical protein